MIAMPENKNLKGYKRFSVDKWDYEYILLIVRKGSDKCNESR